MSSVDRPTSSRIVAVLEQAWAEIQKRNPDVPDVHVTVGMGSTQPGKLTLGHFATHRWHRDEDDPGAHELFVGGEGLRMGAVAVLGTLLHEAAHGLATARGVKDTSRQRRYHNRKYKALAEELGLEASAEDGANGWNLSKVAEETQTEYMEVLFLLESELTLWRENEFGLDFSAFGDMASGDKITVPKQPTATTPRIKTVVACDCDRRIRVARDTLDVASITCGKCGGEFTQRVVEE